MSGIKIGIGFGLWRLGMPSPETICSYAERAEDVGIDSIWLSDHIVSRQPDLVVDGAQFEPRTFNPSQRRPGRLGRKQREEEASKVDRGLHKG